MGKLRNLNAPLPMLKPRVGYVPDAVAPGQSRAFWRPDRAMYKTARWQRLRDAVLLRDEFTCRICGRVDADTSRLVADHIIPAVVRPDLKWDMQNLQCLCQACHATVKQSEDARTRLRGGG